MILVDTSIWVDHLRSGDAALAALLDRGQVLTHPFVIGELALGRMRERERVLGALQDLPRAALATHGEMIRFTIRHELAGIGIGYVDAHLLASVRLTPDAALWTRDKRLRAAAIRLGASAEPRRE